MKVLRRAVATVFAIAATWGNVAHADDEPEIPSGFDHLCEPIKDSASPDDDVLFHFNQHDERLDPNKFVKVVFKIISDLKSDPIKKVLLDYNPILHHLVEEVPMRSMITHVSKSGQIVDKCYNIFIQIHDTNECTFKGRKEWTHDCHSSAHCVNTIGSYYCTCPDTQFAVRGSGNGKCDGEIDSTECCGEVTYAEKNRGDSMYGHFTRIVLFLLGTDNG